MVETGKGKDIFVYVPDISSKIKLTGSLSDVYTRISGTHPEIRKYFLKLQSILIGLVDISH
ncbi:hypothetical protein EG028_00265 [Chitinophaga barathri]|uniref:Uncharacterized protein n=1 Tax=Chitinophaga barathri TaxID=1647451 RepID=A0A3N4MTC1_9BACT|nr:hypothetical protein EG028_00265 [Chitinophaga barathri]